MIHMSEAARQGLKDDETFVIEKRGDIEIKVIVIVTYPVIIIQTSCAVLSFGR